MSDKRSQFDTDLKCEKQQQKAFDKPLSKNSNVEHKNTKDKHKTKVKQYEHIKPSVCSVAGSGSLTLSSASKPFIKSSFLNGGAKSASQASVSGPSAW